VEDGLARWRAANGCPDAVREAERRVGAAGSADAGQTARLLVWEPCEGGASVALWRLTGVGHGWPGNTDVGGRDAIIGPATTLVDAAEEAWRFFEGRSR
jgi:poly(3-hydroxybutyrate) depolymerase